MHRLTVGRYVDRYIGRGVYKIHMIRLSIMSYPTRARRIVKCTGQFQNHPSPPPGQTLGHLSFLKNFGQIPCYVASFDRQMPHPLELQRGSNPPLCHEMHS